MSLSELYLYEDNCTVADVLMAYYGVDNVKDLIVEILSESNIDVLYYWAVSNDMAPSDIFNLIENHLEDIAHFNVISDYNNVTGYPECCLSIEKIPLFMEWALDAA